MRLVGRTKKPMKDRRMAGLNASLQGHVLTFLLLLRLLLLLLLRLFFVLLLLLLLRLLTSPYLALSLPRMRL